MPPLSASDALSPAFRRARLILFEPFDKGRTWKIAATIYIAKSSIIFVPVTLFVFAFLPLIARSAGLLTASAVAAGISVGTLVYVVFYALCSRLQFVAFDMVLYREQFVGPSWRKHRAAASRWFAAKAALGSILTLIGGLPLAIYFYRIFSWSIAHPHSDQVPGSVAPVFAAFFLIFFGTLGLLGLGLFLSDFLVPLLALEDLTIHQACTRCWQLVRVDPWAFVRFVLLKSAIAFIGYYAVLFGLEILMILAMALLALAGLAVGALVHLAGVPWYMLQGIGIVFAFVAYLGFLFYVTPIGMGFFMTFLDCHTLYFLAGRFPRIGELLAPTPPLQPPPLPQAWNPAYTPPPL